MGCGGSAVGVPVCSAGLLWGVEGLPWGCQSAVWVLVCRWGAGLLRGVVEGLLWGTHLLWGAERSAVGYRSSPGCSSCY